MEKGMKEKKVMWFTSAYDFIHISVTQIILDVNQNAVHSLTFISPSMAVKNHESLQQSTKDTIQ